MAQKFDVFICGSGSAGICAATWLARYGLKCKIVESRNGPLQVGHADGVQCRTVEVFDSFNMAEELLREGYHVLETTFWGSDGGKGIVRTTRTADTAPGLSRMPHLILNQSRVNGLLLDAMKRHNGQEVDYGCQVKGVQVDSVASKDPNAYCVTVRCERSGKEEVYHAKYVLGCDGAHSAVRHSLGIQMVGDSTDAVWGVMDVYPRTNFPDIRKKTVIQSSAGSLLNIPREGGSMNRFYVELPAGTTAKDVKIEDLQAHTRKVFHPYTVDIANTFWWSAYVIGRRLADQFTKDDRVFLTGDACHTHSPKAGQGMNVSLQDGYNIGWKLALILKGQVHPDILKTYTLERGKTAADLIAFDRNFATAFASRGPKENGGSKFSDVFIQAGRYTAGLQVTYDESPITWAKQSSQDLAKNLPVGMRFPSTQVVKHCDAQAIQMVKALPADGRWRIVIFAGDVQDGPAFTRLNKLANFLSTEKGPVHKFTAEGADVDSFIETLVLFSGDRLKIEQSHVHDFFWPVTGEWGIRNRHKVFVDDESYNSGFGHAYEFYGVDPKKGAVVIVRPDQYVSAVLDIEDHASIYKFFEGFAIPQQ